MFHRWGVYSPFFIVKYALELPYFHFQWNKNNNNDDDNNNNNTSILAPCSNHKVISIEHDLTIQSQL